MGSVLLINDTATTLQTHLDTLATERGFRVHIARNLSEGLASARESPPDVIVLDLHQLNGCAIDVQPEFLRVAPRATVVFTKNTDSPEPVIDTANHSPSAAIQPVSLDHLDRIICTALEAVRSSTPAEPEPCDRPADDGLQGLREFVRTRLSSGSEDLWEEVRKYVDAVMLPLVLAHTRGNQQQAAAKLGVARQTLRTRLRELGLAPTPQNEPT